MNKTARILQYAGFAAMVVGAILGMHHLQVTIPLVGGAACIYASRKLKSE